jgi:YesN/AraC family two-component response regulator
MKIMIVDDERIIRRGTRAIIEGAGRGWTVIGEAADGNTALEFIRREIPDVLLTDIRMSTMDGIQLAKAVRNLLPDIIIIVVSGYGEFEYAKEAVRFGALDYLLKPTDPADLVRVLGHAEELLRTQKNVKIEKLLLETPVHEELPENGKKPRKLIQDAIAYICRHYEQNISTKDMADILHLNPNYFCDLFKRETGITFLEYLTQLRIKAAQKHLREKINIKTYEVAAMVGYTDSRYFGKLFKSATGLTPSEYRDEFLKR